MDNKYELETQEFRNRYGQVVKEICRKHGIYGDVIYYTPSPISGSDRNRLYVVAGIDSAIGESNATNELKPDEILRRAQRNSKLFYPKVWAYDLADSVSDLQVQLEIVDYCKTAAFLSGLCAEHNCPIPEKLRISEINQLIEYRSVLENPAADPGLRKRCRKALDRFFRREKTKSTFRRKWLDYYRSEQFPDNKGVFARIRGYFKRHSNNSSVKQLLEVNDELHKLEMQEHEYKIFAKLMKETHPDVVFSVGEKDVVDHGLIRHQRSNNAFGRAVTGEEFAVIRKDHFAKEGFSAIAELRPSYWEFRNVYYKATDEPLVAGTYNRIALSYAKPDSLMSLRERGPLALTSIPAADFMNFVSLAKANNLRFYIDHDGDFAIPALESINIVFNEHQEDKMLSIKDRMARDKIEFSHVLPRKHPSLAQTLDSIESTTQKRPQHRPENTYTR